MSIKKIITRDVTLCSLVIVKDVSEERTAPSSGLGTKLSKLVDG
jgi:hypothetical protein